MTYLPPTDSLWANLPEPRATGIAQAQAHADTDSPGWSVRASGSGSASAAATAPNKASSKVLLLARPLVCWQV